MNPLLEQFLEEAKENLKFIEQHLEDLASGDDEMLNAIFRAAHTLKGGSGIVGFEGVRDITHKAEDLLDQLRSKKLTYQANMLDALYDAFDEVLNLVEAAEDAEDVVEADSEKSQTIIACLDTLMGNETSSDENSFILPAIFVNTKEKIKNFDALNFDPVQAHLAEQNVILDENSISQKRPYAIFFDLDNSCMLFGNDPIYAISLLDDKVISMVSGIDNQGAQSILESTDEDDAMSLYMQMTILVDATYEQIEDALYNFIDDIVIYPVCAKDVGIVDHQAEEIAGDAEQATEYVHNKEDAQACSLIIKQQVEQLNFFDDEMTCQRVFRIAQCCFSASNIPFKPSENSKKAILEAMQPLITNDATKAVTQVPDNAVATKVKRATKENQETADKKSVVKERVVENSKKDVISKTVKIEQSAIDQLMSVVGELLVAKNSLPYLADAVDQQESEATKRAILEKYSFIDRLTNQLQDLTMSMRMLPISYVFDRYPKLVRDISKKLGKKVKLMQDGGNTKLDKNMIEMLADPLIHIVRNSLDHGIEAPSDRTSNGKSETGQITMRAYPESDRVLIEIIDDGKGIDANMVVNKVLEKGLMDFETIDQMSDNEKLNLIMLPGLSTAEEISEYSGRGVGMDVVKKSVESFGGTIELESEVGKGTKLVLSIPVSLAVTTLLHVSMDDHHYGFPMDSVSETVKISKHDITCLNNEYYVYIRGEIIPLVIINDMIAIDKIDDEAISIVVLDVKGTQVAVIVNDLLGQIDVVQKPLQGLLSNHSIIGGTALLGNGQIIMVIDPISLWEVSDAFHPETLLEGMIA